MSEFGRDRVWDEMRTWRPHLLLPLPSRAQRERRGFATRRARRHSASRFSRRRAQISGCTYGPLGACLPRMCSLAPPSSPAATCWRRGAYVSLGALRAHRSHAISQIGCGVALPGLVAAMVGARVTMTDAEAHANVLEAARAAAKANRVDACVEALTWGDTGEAALRLRESAPWRWLLAADVLYDEAGETALSLSLSQTRTHTHVRARKRIR